MKTALLLTLATLTCATLALTAQAAPPKASKPGRAVPAKTTADILRDSPAADWRALDPDNTLLMELAGAVGTVGTAGAAGAANTGQVIIELAPRFAPEHAANIRALARGGYYDGLAIVRVQDNFVTQWGDPEGEDATRAKALPVGAKAKLPAEFSVPLGRINPAAGFARLPDRDGWAPRTGFVGGFPVAADPQSGRAWLAHCYGMVGAGRNDAADSSNSTELYAVIGHAPRALDLNITVVGRVLKGMELLAALPRGGAAMGFYEQPHQRTGISRVRLLSEVPVAERPAIQVLRTESATWPQLLDARRYRSGWYVHSSGHIDICSAAVPTRPTP